MSDLIFLLFSAQVIQMAEETETEVEAFNKMDGSPVNEDFPSQSQQSQIISDIDSECTCTYAVSRVWYRKWEEYVGIQRSEEGDPPLPGPIDMDSHNDTNNEYIHEEAWKLLLKWYGITPTHQLDRKHLYFKDEKMFDICTLSPFSGIVEHAVKKFNRFEEIGYIECQLRRVFRVQEYKRTRLWISEKAQVPRFRQLLLRFRMLNDCIHRDKVYILALEEAINQDTWPTGEPGEAKGDLGKYEDLMQGKKSQDFWAREISNSLSMLQTSVAASIKEMAEGVMQNAHSVLKEKETQLSTTQRAAEVKLEEVNAKDKFLDEKARQFARQEELLRIDREKLAQETEQFQAKQKEFQEELERMESLHKIQESKIKLDIGGCTYTTSIQTLKRDPDSMLAAMFSGRHELKQEADGSYFIDRDGTHFRYILNFLREGQVDPSVLPNDVGNMKELLREAKYYQLNGLVAYLEDTVTLNSPR